MEACPLESTKRSRSTHSGCAGLYLRKSPHRTWAMSAIPIGAPGCPDLARSTASIESARMQLASSRRVVIGSSFEVEGRVRKRTVCHSAAQTPQLVRARGRRAAENLRHQDVVRHAASPCCLAAPTWAHSHATLASVDATICRRLASQFLAFYTVLRHVHEQPSALHDPVHCRAPGTLCYAV